MHDLDRTTLEMDGEAFSYEFDAETDGELGAEGELETQEEAEAGMEPEAAMELEAQEEAEAQAQAQGESELEAEAEAQLDELAAELLEVGSEGELDQFLGRLIQRVASSLGTRVRGPMGRRLGLHLKRALRRMPSFMAFQRAGGGSRWRSGARRLTRLGAGSPPVQGDGAVASEVFGLELEGLSHEDQELEMARRVVQLAADAAQTALSTPHEEREEEVSQGAVARAMERYAPGLIGTRPLATPLRGSVTSGRWVRKGNRITLLGV
jgi:hypothetical protein